MHRNIAADKENLGQDQIKFSHGEIARRACQFWEAAGQPVGRDAEFWLQAEAELFANAHSGPSPEAGVSKRGRSAKRPSQSLP
jgi:hypothetical protein